MKIAVCFSGQIRTGIEASANIKRFIGDLYPMCDFFIHTWNYNSVKPCNNTNYIPIENHFLNEEAIENFKNVYNPKIFKVDDYNQFLIKDQTACMWYSVAQSLKFVDLESYDVVVKMRPDIIYPPTRRLSHEIIHYMKDPTIFYSDIFHTTRVDDVFWVLSCHTVKKILPYTEQFKNKSLLQYLEENNIENKSTYRTIMHYAPYRFESLQYDCMTQFKECYKLDLLMFSGENEHIINERFSTGDLSSDDQYQ
jgi:hypothetical protein